MIATAHSNKKNKFQWKHCLILSCVIHSVVNILWILPSIGQWFTVPIASAPRPPVNIKIHQQSAKSLIGEVQLQAKAYQRLNPKERRETFSKLAEQARDISQKSILDIGKYLGADPNTYNPDKAPKNARFDLNTLALYAIKKHTYKDKRQGYNVTLIDHQGVTMLLKVPPDETAAYDQMYFIFNMAEKNPALKTFIHKILNPLLPKLLGMKSSPKTRNTNKKLKK